LVAQSKGTIYLSVERFVLDRWGRETLAECLGDLSREDQAILDNVLAVGWYPLEPVIRFHRVVDRRMGRGDLSLVEEIGRFSAEWQLNAFHKLILRFKNPQWMVSKAGSMWGRYHETGEWEVETPEEGMVVGRLRNFAVADECFCTRERGWFARAVELTGGRNVKVWEPKCRAKGAAYCEYRGTYIPR